MHLLEAKGLLGFVCSQDVTSEVLHTDIMADLKIGGVCLEFKGILAAAAAVEYSQQIVYIHSEIKRICVLAVYRKEGKIKSKRRAL